MPITSQVLDELLKEYKTPDLYIKSLTRHFQSGEIYERLPEVERQIEEALRLEPKALLERLNETDKESPRYLKEEVLVYLIRDFYGRSKQRHVFEALSSTLTKRCLTHISQYARRFIKPNLIADCASEILSVAFGQILDIDTDRGDYIQVRFWHFLKRLEADITKKYNRDQEKERKTDSYDIDSDDNEERGLSVDNIAQAKTLSPVDLLMLKEGLLLLPEPLRTAFILHHQDGWQIESNDLQTPTLATYLNKTPRTIRNWLARAEEILQGWRGEKQ